MDAATEGNETRKMQALKKSIQSIKDLRSGAMALFTMSLAMTNACGKQDAAPAKAGAVSALGTVELRIGQVSGADLVSLQYAVRLNGEKLGSGVVNPSAGGAMLQLLSLAPGDGYELEASAESRDASVTCSGTADFSVSAGETTSVLLEINCAAAEAPGAADVDVEFNDCPSLKSIVTSPSTGKLGEFVSFQARAEDPNADALSYRWLVNGVVYGNTAEAKFRCVEEGQHDVELKVGDGACEVVRGFQIQCELGSGSESTTGTASDGSGADGSSSSKDDSTDGSSSGPDQQEPLEILRSEDRVVNLFVDEDTIWVVLSNAVRAYRTNGELIGSYDSPREITSADWWKGQVVVSDKARILAIGADFEARVISELELACASSVIVKQNLWICGPSNDWDRIFTTYDLESGEIKGRSRSYTYNGIPMRRVPGRDAFVTVSVGTSPSDFHLYTVNEEGVAEFYMESPYHGDMKATRTMSFVGMPAKALMNTEGTFFNVGEGDCPENLVDDRENCLVKNGLLGTNFSPNFFLALTDEAEDEIFTIEGRRSVWPAKEDERIRAQRIDLIEKKVVSQREYKLSGRFEHLRHIESSRKLVVAVSDDSRPRFDPREYAVVILSYESK